MTTILLVEDELLIRLAMADALVDAGYRVLEACDAAEALEILATQRWIDVLVTDVWMPGAVDGLALARTAADERQCGAVIVISGHARPAPDDLPHGAIFVAKPFRPATLVGMVGRLVDAPGAATQDAPYANSVRRRALEPDEAGWPVVEPS